MRARSFLPALITILALFISIPAESGEFNGTMASLLLRGSIEASLPSNAKWSFSAVDLDTGRILVDAGNSQHSPLVPGSLVKLFLTAAVLDLGAKEDIEPVTVLAHDGIISQGKLAGNLYMKGSGNAFISGTDLRKAVGEILTRNVHEITGDIVIDDLLFNAKGLSSGYHGPAYSAPAALGFDMHTVAG